MSLRRVTVETHGEAFVKEVDALVKELNASAASGLITRAALVHMGRVSQLLDAHKRRQRTEPEHGTT